MTDPARNAARWRYGGAAVALVGILLIGIGSSFSLWWLGIGLAVEIIGAAMTLRVPARRSARRPSP